MKSIATAVIVATTLFATAAFAMSNSGGSGDWKKSLWEQIQTKGK